MKHLSLIVTALLLASCGKPDAKNLEEVAQRELIVENVNLERRAAKLEIDLEKKQLFFTALEGTYEGSFKAGEKIFKTRMTFIPSLPPYTSNRIRTLEEITADLNNLYFSVQTTHWNSNGTAVAAGCIFSQMSPDYDNGQIVAATETCPNVYKVNMFDSSESTEESPINTAELSRQSKILSKKISRKEIQKIEEIYIVIQPTLLAKTFTAVLKRVQP